MKNLCYDDICFLVALLRKIEEQEAITLFCIIEQLLIIKEQMNGEK